MNLKKRLSFKVKYETIPVLNIKDYKGLVFDIPDLVVGEDEIAKEIDYILRSNKTLEDAEVILDNNFIIDAEIITY